MGDFEVSRAVLLGGSGRYGTFYISAVSGSALFRKLKEEGKINMDDGAHFYDLIYVDSFLYYKFYNERIHPFWLKFYQFSAYVIFYGTNFLFRPLRLFKMIKNIHAKKYESRR